LFSLLKRLYSSAYFLDFSGATEYQERVSKEMISKEKVNKKMISS